MDLLFQNAQLINPETGTVGQGALGVKDGQIAEVWQGAAPGETKAAQVVDCAEKHLGPGLVDIGVKVCEPGERHKESFRSAGRAAAAGGVTSIVTRPDTLPAIDSPETLEFVLRRAREATDVRVYPMAALTKGREGREMTEIGFLLDAGAVAFSDGDRVVTNTKVFSRALTYANSLGALVLGHVQEPVLSDGAAVTSGKFASLRGLPGVSPMAERMGLERDLALIEMTGARYHVDQITTAQALGALARAKGALDMTVGTSIHHLTLNALDVADYRTFFKLKPPLRDEEDRLACVEAVGSGAIDIISSMHTPQDEESKRLPFEAAASGAVGVETMLSAALRLYHAGYLELAVLWRAMSLAPAKRLGLPQGRLQAGAPADLVLCDVNAPYTLDRFALQSKSQNTPFDGALMQGKVLATYVAGEKIYERN
ncbi:MAG: dihydroorotase [Rhodobacteraceae bacterium]|nr:dihydroorotase [Paracoccaceae bacterium]